MSTVNTHDEMRAMRQALESFRSFTEVDQTMVKAQLEHCVTHGLACAVEHAESSDGWTDWKLPLVGETDISEILKHVVECAEAYPDHNVRLVAYDHHRQAQGLPLVVRRPFGQ